MRALAVIFALALSRGPACAADGAAFDVIGYSPGARYFAFEQYGIPDASVFPYWDVIIVDLKTGEWVKGTPIHVMIEEEGAAIAAAREKAREAAVPTLRELDISEPAELLAANPATEVVADRHRISFDRWYVSGGSKPDSKGGDVIRQALVIEPVKLPAPANCRPDEGGYFGFNLTIDDMRTGTSRALHRDKAIPASRGCPYDYDLTAVVAPAGYPVTDRLVAIIGVYSQGFEGSDHRFITVPFTISD